MYIILKEIQAELHEKHITDNIHCMNDIYDISTEF